MYDRQHVKRASEHQMASWHLALMMPPGRILSIPRYPPPDRREWVWISVSNTNRYQEATLAGFRAKNSARTMWHETLRTAPRARSQGL
jgi:hypothetical protein